MRIALVLALTLGCAADSEDDQTAEVAEEVITPEQDAAPARVRLPPPATGCVPEQSGSGGRPTPDLPVNDLTLPDPIEQ
jgi:hypothetical protein